jgi:hypothetical protein
MRQKKSQEQTSKPKKQIKYFDKVTEQAIIDFQNEPSPEIRKTIFVERIAPSFSKLIENLIFVYGFHTLGNIDTLKNDCLSHLFENLYKWQADKGHKAFSYFNVCGRNWFIQKWKGTRKKNKTDVTFDKELMQTLEKTSDDILVPSYEEELIDFEFSNLLREDIRSWRKKMIKPQEKKVLEAIILLIENPESVTIYNKKGIYLYIREITGLNTKQIVTNLSKLRKRYELFKKRYENGDI